jgi:glycosyltransferase involved in cell wall biosynthesis
MLTWSDWKTEPRSNRYHYAVRLARRWPVYFVQPDGHGQEISFEKVPGHDITLVHVAPRYTLAQAARLAEALRARGATRPLVWLYNVCMAQAVPRLHPALAIYHATEDYVSPSDAVRITLDDISAHALEAIAQVDMIVAVSEGVAESHRRALRGAKPVHVVENGCDFEFWDQTGAAAYQPPGDGAKVALFQGGINGRLDYTLLTRLAKLLPDWQFWFCGKSVDGGREWAALRKLANVRDFGLLDSAGIAALAKQALVGLIPFKESDLMRRSLPLKAYEYLACGLPVATVPIDALAANPGLFETAHGADDFARALRKLGATRTDSDALARRREAAKAASYDGRFNRLLDLMAERLHAQAALRPSLNILMLYDDRSTHVGTITEHLDAFRKYSRHKVHFLPATGFVVMADANATPPDFSVYDAILIHYSVRVSVEGHLSQGVARAVEAYRGPKLLFIQDEYDRVETSRRCMERLGVDAVFTCVPLDEIDKVYPRARFPHVEFLPNLTGYVPEEVDIDSFALPLAERTLRIAYRGRALPHHYGALGQEKFTIGVEMKRLARDRGIPADIEVDDARRIYGLDWYRFIGSARATLGTESGANVFDMDGSLAALAEQHRDMPFEEFARCFLGEHEGLVHMNQISPKIFEAVRLRTALVLFEGSYSGVVRAHEHYIPLAKDYSNVDEVFAKLEDVRFLEALTERAYRDVIGTGAYSYRRFIEEVDGYLSRRAGGRRRATILSRPVFAVYSPGNADALPPAGAGAPLLNDAILGPSLPREQVEAMAAAISQSWSGSIHAIMPDLGDRTTGNQTAHVMVIESNPVSSKDDMGMSRRIWRLLPERMRHRLAREMKAALREDAAPTPSANVLRRLLRLLPGSLRAGIRAKLG